ncbi:hypothetical protein DMENIID0001_171540 [Sergentomyia squamirostris]
MCRGVFVNEVEVVKKEAMEGNLHVFPDFIEEEVAEFNWADFDNFNFATMTRVYDVVRSDHEIIDQLKEAIRDRDEEMARLIMADVEEVLRECEERFRG